jgi:hypothetical protein
MEAIRATIKNVMGLLEVKKANTPLGGAQDLFKKNLKKRDLAHIKFNYFRKGIIYVNVDSSSWLYALSLKKDCLLMKLRKEIAGLKDIRFRIGEVK